MNFRNVRSSAGRRRFQHQQDHIQKQLIQNAIIRPPTSHPYGSFKSSSKMRNQYSLNFITDHLPMDATKRGPSPGKLKGEDSLPKDIKYQIDALRVLFKNHDNKSQFSQILTSLVKRMLQQIETANNHLTLHQLSAQQLQEKEHKIEELEETIKKLEKQELELRQRKTRSSKAQQEIKLETIQLMQVTQQYERTITQFKKQQQQSHHCKQQEAYLTPFTENKETKESELNHQLLRKNNRIKYLEMKLLNAQDKEMEMQNKYEQLQEELRSKSGHMEEVYEKQLLLQERLNQWRERSMMHSEDSQAQIARQGFLLYSIRKLKESYKKLADKLIKQGSNMPKMDKQIDNNPCFQYEVDFFNTIRTYHCDPKQYSLNISQQNSQVPNQSNQNQKKKDKDKDNQEGQKKEDSKKDSKKDSKCQSKRESKGESKKEIKDDSKKESEDESKVQTKKEIRIETKKEIKGENDSDQENKDLESNKSTEKKIDDSESCAKNQNYQKYRSGQQINLRQYSYLKPTFFAFIQESMNPADITSCRMKGNIAVLRLFVQILRAIMNSKTNQFLYCREQQYTRFPEFVYSWFQKFCFNSELNKVTALQPFSMNYLQQKPVPQDAFYRDLMNIKLDQSWEIITFREFLLEQLSMEELYFYLMCQNLLFKRAGITAETQYRGQFCILVEYSSAKAVLDLIFSEYECWNINFMNSKLREKIIMKKKIQYVESGFMLRCLVQYYKIERINRYKYLNKLYQEFKGDKGFKFHSFTSVINRFTQVPIEQKMALYRDCYSVGRGNITPDVIFTVCSQQLIFLRYFKIKCFYTLPSITPSRRIKLAEQEPIEPAKVNPILCIQPSDPYIYDIFIGVNKLLKNKEEFMSRVESMSIMETQNHLRILSKIFSEKITRNDTTSLRCKHLIHFISETFNKVRQINFHNFYDLVDEQNKKKSRNPNTFYIDIEESDLCDLMTEEYRVTLSIYYKLTEQIKWKNRVYQFRIDHAARKIQKIVRKKILKPYLEVYQRMFSEFKKN